MRVKKNNVRGEVQSSNRFPIEVVITEGSKVLRLESEVSLDRMAFMTTGDQIIGPGIPDDVFIEAIDVTNHTVTVSKEMDLTKTLVVEVLCRVQYYPKPTDKDFWSYRVKDSKLGQATSQSIFEEAIERGESPATFQLLPAIDLSDWREQFITKVQNSTPERDLFNKLCRDLYKKVPSNSVRPAVLNSEGDLLMDALAWTTFDVKGKSYISHQKTLDYLEEYKDEMARVSDALKIGASINGYSDGSVRTIDKTLNSSFFLTPKWKTENPYYIKIGTGQLPDSLFLDEEEVEEVAAEDASYYNDAYYGDAYWSTRTLKQAEEKDWVIDIDKPLFRSQLSEYEVEKLKNGYTALQFAVMRRVFSNFVKDTDNAYVYSARVKDLNIFNICLDDSRSMLCYYCGEAVDVDVCKFQKPGFLNYYALDSKSWAFSLDGTTWERKMAQVYGGSLRAIEASKDETKVFFCNDDSGKAALFVGGQFVVLSFFKNVYYSEYDGATPMKGELVSCSLGVTDIVKGSFSSTFIIRENLWTKGYEYSEDGRSVLYGKPVEKISLVEDFIYCDEENEVLYTYNGGKKVMIDQENNHYFKNIINNVVKFSKKEAFTPNGLVEKYFISGHEDFDFDIDKMSLKDRILSIEKIDIRNSYEQSNEPVMFSNYQTVRLYLRGLLEAEDSLLFNFGYKLKLDPKAAIQKSKALIEEKKLRPYNSDTETQYEKDDLLFNSSVFEGATVPAPEYIESVFTDEQNVVKGFEFYKSLLVMEGKVDLKNPTRISFELQPSLDGLDMVQTGDEIHSAVYLSPTVADSYAEPYTTIIDVKALDLKNKVFCVGAKDALYFFNCADLSSFETKDQPYTKIAFDDGDILTSVIWDKVRDCWIYSLEVESDGSFAGCYSVKTVYSAEGAPIAERVQEFDQSLNSTDINTYQFLQPMKTTDADVIKMSDEESLTYNNDERVLARDFALRDIPSSMVEQSETRISEIKIEATKYYQLSMISAKLPKNSDWIELDFDMVPTGKDSLSIEGTSCGYYVFDKSLGRWTYSTAPVYNFIAKGITEKTHAHVTIVSKEITTGNYLYENGHAITKTEYFEQHDGSGAEGGVLAQFLWVLPRPATNKNECSIVVVADDPTALSLFTSKSDMRLRQIVIKSKALIKGALYDYEGKFLKPKYENGFWADYGDKKLLMAYNEDGYEAVLNGDTLFMKSPTRLWKPTASGEWLPADASADFFWKKAQIPSQKDLSFLLFSALSIEEAYALVCQQKANFVEYLQGLSSKDEVQKALYAWLKDPKNDPIIPERALDIIESAPDGYDYTTSFEMKGVEFLQSPDGVYVNVNPLARQQYVIPQNLAIQGGYTVEAKVREETYLQYLRDYYEIILGCNRLSDIVSAGVKAMKLTSTDLMLLTRTDDVLTLPLDCTYSRDDIENHNNWEVHSLAPSKEVPTLAKSSDFTTYDYTIGCTNGTEETVNHYTTSMQLVTKKLYTITCCYVERNVQIFGGWYKWDQDALNFYSKAGASTEQLAAVVKEGTFSRPFVAWSQDSGVTWEELDCTSISGFGFAAYDSAVSAIYKIGSFIRISVSGNGKVQDTDFKIDLAGMQYILTNTANFVDRPAQDFQYEISSQFTDAGLICDTTPYAICKNKFFLAISKAKAFTGKIISKEVDAITVEASGYFTSTAESEEVPVLVAIYTAKSISDQWRYLRAHDARYYTDYGELKVPYLEAVTSQEDANFLYSKNEALPLTEQDEMAITCFANDKNKTVYSYSTSVDDVLVEERMYNSFDDPIYLIDTTTGRFLLSRNPSNVMTQALSFKNMVDDSLNGDVLVQAIQLSPEFLYLGNSYGMTDFFERMDDFISLKSMSFSVDNPRLVVSVKKDEAWKQLLDEGLFYKWPAEVKPATTDAELQSLIDSGVGFYGKLKELSLDGATITTEWFFATFERVKLSDSFYGIKEKATGTVLTRELISELTVSLPYSSYQDLSIFYGQSLATDEDGILPRVKDKSVCAIGLGTKGYGSTIDTTEWNDAGPLELDPTAFQTKLLRNDLGNYVYLSDLAGTKVLMRSGLFDMNVSEEAEISYDNLCKVGENVVDVYLDDHGVDVGMTPALRRYFYKIPASSLSVWCPQDTVSFCGEPKGFLTLLRAYHSDVEMHDLTVKCLTKFYADQELTEELKEINLYYKDGSVFFEGVPSQTPVYTDGMVLEFAVTSGSETVTKRLLLANKAIPRVLNLDFVLIGDFSKEVTMVLDKPLDSIKIVGDGLLFMKRQDSTSYTFKILNSVAINTTVNGIHFDIHKMEPVLYLSSRLGFSGRPQAKVYSHELDITELFEFEWSDKAVKASYMDVELTAEWEPGLEEDELLSASEFVFTQLSEPIKYRTSKNVVVRGLYGAYILPVPAFSSFKELIDTNGRKIQRGLSAYEYGKQSLIEFKDIGDAAVEISADIGEGYYTLKVLPIQTFYPDVSTMNSPDYYTQVSVHEISLFGYDRVWVNPKLFKDPAFEYDGKFLNGDSMSQYSVDTWKNKDGFMVWLSDAQGHFVKPVIVGTDVSYQRIGDAQGNCSTEIYQSHEARINPCELLYKTAYDYYKSTYWTKGLKTNPFLKKYRVESFKENGKVEYKTYFFRDAIKRKQLAEELIDDYSIDKFSFDYESSAMSWQVYYDLSHASRDELSYFRGIEYNNLYADDTIYRIPVSIETVSDFIIDSLEDVENDEAPTVADVTEVGIFSKRGHLLAYMKHPIAQYDTKKNYLAYQLLVH